MEIIAVLFALLIWIVSLLIKFFRWAGRKINTVNTAPAPIQQAMAEAQRQAEMQRQAMPPPYPAPQYPQRPQPPVPPWEMPRQPQAGPPAVPYEATDQDFRRQELELLTEEPASLDTPLRSDTPFSASRELRLFETDDDLVRAFILQEALGPPLCRRGR